MSEDYARKMGLNVGGLREENGAQCRRITRGKGGSMWEDYATKRGSMSEDYAMKRVLNVGGLCDDKGAECGRIMRGKGGTVCEDYATKRC